MHLIYGYLKQREAVIETNATNFLRFARCNNSKCKSIFICDPREILGETGFLCPICKIKLDSHHIVQCTNCQSVIDLIAAEPSEEPVVFYVDRCSKCNGTIEDERHVRPFYFPDAFI